MNNLIAFCKIILKLQLIKFSIQSITTVSLHEFYIISVLLGPFGSTVLFNERSHAPIIQVFGFAQITNVDLQLSHLILILYCEVKPIGMPSGVGVASDK